MPDAGRRRTAIPRASPPKRAVPPPPPPVKRNEPIPLRGTRPSTLARDAHAPVSQPSRVPSAPRFHVPVMRSPGLSSRASSASVYSQSGEFAGSKYEIEAEARAMQKEEIEEGSETDGELDDAAMSPGFSRIMALLEPEADMKGAGSEVTCAADGKTDVRHQDRTTSSPRAGVMKSSPVLILGRKDSESTPRAGARQSTKVSEGIDCMTAVDAALPRTPTLPRVPPGPHAILRELETLLGPALVAEIIDLPRILGAHDACPAPSTPPSGTSVFGAPLCTAARYASCSAVLGGQTHMLPIVVFAAVEELYRTGLTSPRLLRPASTGCGTTLPALVAAFDTPPAYGDGRDLAAATPLDDVSALLLTYLDCLPGPIIVRPLQRALRRLLPARGVRAAQLVLRLLPAPHFSLLVYLLAFLAQVPAHGRANGWGVQDAAAGFARAVCGAGEDGDGGAGREVLAWLLHDWDALSAGLFPGAAPCGEDDLGPRIAALEAQHAAAVRAAYQAGAAAERGLWAREVQALREAWEREGRVVGGIVQRLAEGALGKRGWG